MYFACFIKSGCIQGSPKLPLNKILLSKLGINYNTLKIRPPMSFSLKNADFLLEKLDKVLLKNQIPLCG